MKVLSLFDGISCGMIALERAKIDVESYVAYEIDKYAIEVSKKNYSSIIHKGDVFSHTINDKADLVIGGSPCTYWSIARRNREVTNSGMGFTLFMKYVEALYNSGATYFLYENNYNIHKDIQDEITKYLGVNPVMINSNLVSAQNRKRLYWTNIPNVSQPIDKSIYLQDIIDSGFVYRNKSHCLTSNYYGAIIWNSLERGQRTMVAEPANDQVVDNYSVYCINNGYMTAKVNSQSGEIITKHLAINLPNGNYTFRKLTPIECERLQTLPDDYTSGISDTQRYKLIGNGWTVDIISHILGYINGSSEVRINKPKKLFWG
jgi:DNA (cytosine-5)-methyltransferase 3A